MSSSHPTRRRARPLVAALLVLSAVALAACTSPDDEASEVLTAVPATSTTAELSTATTAPSASPSPDSSAASGDVSGSGPVSSGEGGGGQTPAPDPVTVPTPHDTSPVATPDVVTAPPAESGDDGRSDALDINADREVEVETGGDPTVLSGTVVSGQVDRYSLQALSGQTLSIDITSSEENAVIDLFTPSGSRIMGEKTSDTVTLSEDGVYEVIVHLLRGDATYEISFQIE